MNAEVHTASGPARSEKEQQFVANRKAVYVDAAAVEAHQKPVGLGNSAEESSVTADINTA